MTGPRSLILDRGPVTPPIVQLVAESVGTLVAPAAQGPPGPANRQTYVYHQATPALQWTIRHGQHNYPAVTVMSTADDLLLVDYKYVDENTVLIVFGYPTNGTAYLN